MTPTPNNEALAALTPAEMQAAIQEGLRIWGNSIGGTEEEEVANAVQRAILAKLSSGQAASAVPEGCTPADAMVLRKANHALAEDNERLRIALRFYANGEHFNTDDKEEFDTVSGEPTNWLCSGVDGSTTMIEDGSVAAMALRGIHANWKDGDEDLTPKPIDGEQWSSPTQPASAPARGGESELAVLMDRNAWRAAMIGLCTGRDYDVRTPELAAEHLRKRLATPAAPAQPQTCGVCDGAGVIGTPGEPCFGCKVRALGNQYAAAQWREDMDAAKRLRLICKLLGLESAIPDGDESLIGCLFPVLGMIRRAIEERLSTPPAPRAPSIEPAPLLRAFLDEADRAGITHLNPSALAAPASAGVEEFPLPEIEEALRDILAGWVYIRQTYGDLYGPGWDCTQTKAEAALQRLRSYSASLGKSSHD